MLMTLMSSICCYKKAYAVPIDGICKYILVFREDNILKVKFGILDYRFGDKVMTSLIMSLTMENKAFINIFYITLSTLNTFINL